MTKRECSRTGRLVCPGPDRYSGQRSSKVDGLRMPKPLSLQNCVVIPRTVGHCLDSRSQFELRGAGDEAIVVHDRFVKAWKDADTNITTSVF